MTESETTNMAVRLYKYINSTMDLYSDENNINRDQDSREWWDGMVAESNETLRLIKARTGSGLLECGVCGEFCLASENPNTCDSCGYVGLCEVAEK